jgi:hypothetical protein
MRYKTIRVFTILASLALLLASIGQLAAQVTTATITGTVTDASGAAVPDASVQVKNAGTGITQNAASDAQGRFNVPSLVVGDYEVQASKMGFQSLVRRGITLTVGGTAVVDFSMQVGQTQTTVEVQGQISQVETTSSTVSNLVEQKQISDLPLNGRNFQQLILLAPGVNVAQTATTSFYGKGDTYSVAGGRPEGQAYLLDGTDITNFFNHGSGAGSLGTSLGIDAIAEFQTLTNTYSAQFGGNGAVINAVSKSGTNAFHGSGFEFLRNSALDARDFFANTSSPPPFRRNQFGGAIGGPIKKDKLFFFFNYEGLKQSLGITNKVTVPNLAAHNGDITNPNGTLTHIGFASPLIGQILALYPTAGLIPITNAAGQTSLANAFSNGTQVGDEHYLLGRMDYNISTKDSLFARYVLDKSTFNNPFPGTNIGLWNDSEPTRNQYLTAELRHIVSPTVINVTRGSYVRTENSATTLGETPALQFYPHQGGQDGNIAITGLTGLGPSALAPYILIQNKFALSNDIYFTRGAHNIKFGLGMQRIQTFENQPFSAAGSFSFASLTTFLQGTPNRYGGAYPIGVPNPFSGNLNPDAYRSFRETMIIPYINDDWKVTSKLTLNLGIRYDYDTNPKSAINNLLVIANPPFNSIGGGLSTTNYLKQVPNVWRTNPNLNNWGPRIGFAFDPFKDHKTSIRGGFGDTHNVIAPRTYTSGYVTGAPFPSVIITPTVQTPVIAFPNPFAGTFVQPPYGNGQAVDYNNTKTPALYQWNLNVQRELPASVILTVGYVGSHGSHLFTGSDQNPPIATTDANGVLHFGTVSTSGVGLSNARWNPAMGVVNALQTNGRSSYNSLQTNAVHRFSKNFQAQVAYTWGHSTDDGSASSGLETSGGGRSNPYNFASERGNSTFDIRQTLRVNGVYALPFKGNKFVQGWQISGIMSKTTGPPIVVTTGIDQALTGQAVNQRPNITPGATVDATQIGTVSQWYNPLSYTLQPIGTEGNAGRNIIRGPGVFNADAALLKDTKIPKISEQFAVQFRAEFFNFLNHENFGIPNLSLFTSSTGARNAAAGQIVTSNPGTIPRQIQFAIKIVF